MTYEDIERIYGKKIARKLPTPDSNKLLPLPEIDARSSWDENVTDYDNREHISPEDGDADSYFYKKGIDTTDNTLRVVEEYEMRYESVDRYYDIIEGELVDFGFRDGKYVNAYAMARVRPTKVAILA